MNKKAGNTCLEEEAKVGVEKVEREGGKAVLCFRREERVELSLGHKDVEGLSWSWALLLSLPGLVSPFLPS